MYIEDGREVLFDWRVVHHTKAAYLGDRRKNPFPSAIGRKLVDYV